MNCTWKNCNNEGKHSQKDKDGNEWTFLCEDHNKELDESIINFNAKKVLSCWVKAQGGAKIERLWVN